MWLDALAHGNALEARSVAHEILGNRTDYPSLIVFKAADICFQEVNELPQAEQQQALVDLETVFSESVIGLEIAGVPASARSGAYALLGTCQNRLGEVGEARRSFDRALNLDPNFVAALVARGMLLYDANAELRSEAVSDFQRAIQLGSTLPWPYFFLAHDALSDDRFEEALQLASATLRMNASDHLRAYCLHWIAIAMASLGYPLALVRSVFENAIQLAPDEKQFQVNLELFDAAAQDSPRSHARWEKTPANRIQGFALREYQPVGVAT
jgi:tetratricopeptide (TPR) repeat protein